MSTAADGGPQQQHKSHVVDAEHAESEAPESADGRSEEAALAESELVDSTARENLIRTWCVGESADAPTKGNVSV